MHTDSMFVIGNRHISGGLPCQDYAISSPEPKHGVDDQKPESDFAYAIVSDGCSSGRRTDVGARITVTAMEQALLNNSGEQAGLWKSQRSSMLTAMSALGCDFRDLFATCIYAYCSPNEQYVHVRGDGAVAWKYPDGNIEMTSFEWGIDHTDPPFYPAYALHDTALEAFKLHYSVYPEGAMRSMRHTVTSEGATKLEGITYSLNEGIEGIRLPIPPEAQMVAIFTDGVMQVPGLEWYEVIEQLLAFKSSKGLFVKRRMRRFLDTRAKEGSHPGDDLAYAVIDLQE